MKIIKLDAIDSTSSFLKNMAVDTILEDFTVVVAKTQFSGRGQMNTKWQVESGKNLTFSVFLRDLGLPVSEQKSLSFCVSLSVYEALKKFNLPKMAIKWPNDILSENKKIAGILIENSLKGNEVSTSVIGIGVNVNQEVFTEDLPNAISMKMLLKSEIDIEMLMNGILKNLKEKISILKRKEHFFLKEEYLKVLYKKNVPSMFKDNQNTLFMGKIIGVSNNGKLQIELVDETIKEFDLKEVSFA